LACPVWRCWRAAARAEKHREGWNTIELDADGSTGAPPDDRRLGALRTGQDTAFFLWQVSVTAAHAR
jgi:hypothetical protein